MPSAAMELRQSTTVPNVSNTSAFTLDNFGFTSFMSRGASLAWIARSSENDIAAAPAPAAARKFRRFSVRRMWTCLLVDCGKTRGSALLNEAKNFSFAYFLVLTIEQRFFASLRMTIVNFLP